MRFRTALTILLLLCGSSHAQDRNKGKNKDKQPPSREARSVTVPATIDHNRVIIDVDVPALNGNLERVRAWIATGSSELFESRRAAGIVGKNIECSAQICSVFAPPKVVVGDMDISFDSIKSAGVPIWPDFDHPDTTVVIPGVKAEMNLPSSVLRHYDVLVDFPGKKVTIGTPGTIHFNGVSAKVQIDAETGAISVPSKIDNKKYDLKLDLGSPMSSLRLDLFDALATAHPDWPHITGAVGPVSEWGTDQLKRMVMRLDRLQFGPLFLTDVAVTATVKDRMEIPGKPVDVAGTGMLGSEALQNYRVGIDYAHSTVYFDIGRLYNFPDFDVIGLILNPESDGKFTILGVADFEGKPSIPSGPDGVQPGDHLVAVDEISVQGVSMGQLWSMLGGAPGQERKLTVEREGKQFVVAANVRHFLAEPPDDNDTKKKK